MNTAYIAITLGGLSPENVETIYNKRLQSYYFDHSREVKFTPDYDGKEYDTQGNIINAEFDKIYKTGVPIPEKDFIKQQLKSIEKVPLIGLKQHEKALLSYYKDYLDLRLNATNETQQSKETKPDEVKKELTKNRYAKIFNNDLGFTLFNKMYEYYKDETLKKLANFSFLFYAMQEEFLVCNQKEFLDFIGNDEYQISISKIDSRQYKAENKTKLYNSTKQSFQKKNT